MPVSEVILVSMGLLSIAILAAGLFRNFSIPYTVLLVVIGIILSELARVWAFLQPLESFQLTPDLVFFIFLPALIFESGLSLNTRQLLKDLAPILTLAVPALLISTSLVGLGMWWLLDIDLTVALLFGALISATDPVAVVTLFRELGAPVRLNVLVEGESLLNDATAIVVFGILLGMVMDNSSLSLLSTGSAIIEFVRVFIGGTLVGVLTGVLVSEMLFRLQSSKSAILTMSIVSAYASFILAEHVLHVSGVMATVSASVTLSVYGLTRISMDAKPLLTETWEFVSLVANSLLFLLVGLSINTADLFTHMGSVFIVIFIVLLARAATVYSLVPTTIRLFKLPRVSLAERHIMWWGGLKGGLAIAIVLSIPEELPGRDLLIILTLGVVLFTLMVNAWTIRPLMQYLKLDRFNEEEQLELDQGLEHAQITAAELLQRYQSLGIISDKLHQRLGQLIKSNFSSAKPENNAAQHWKKNYRAAIQVEISTLNDLYRTGLIGQYTLVNILNTLQLDLENSRLKRGLLYSQADAKKSIFQRLEMGTLKLLREKNWAAGLLSNFQYRRLELLIQRAIAGIVMSSAVVDMLDAVDNPAKEGRKEISEFYKQRLHRRLQRLHNLRIEFPDIFEAVEKQIFTRSALVSARVNAENEWVHGEIGVKAYARISQIIEALLLQELSSEKYQNHDMADCIRRVPLFADLPESLIKVLADHLYQVTFISGDIIIGEGDKGDALYIIHRGHAEVSKKDISDNTIVLRELVERNFFGEMALLGDHVRTATVKAKTSMTLLRLSRTDILKISKQFEEIKHRLEQARDERLKMLQ